MGILNFLNRTKNPPKKLKPQSSPNTPTKVSDVFKESALPALSFVDRSKEHDSIRHLKRDLQTDGMIVCVYGPSKFGKSTFIQQIAKEKGVRFREISGADIQDVESFWEQLGAALGVIIKTTQQELTVTSNENSVSAETEAKVNSPLGSAGVSISAIGQSAVSNESQTGGHHIQTLKSQCEDHLKRNDGTWILVDDFHFSCRGPVENYHTRDVSRKLRKEIFESVKSIAEHGIAKFIFLSIPNDAVTPHIKPDNLTVDEQFEGRVSSVEFPNWLEDELVQIPKLGFKALGISLEEKYQKRIANAALGSPFNCQAICINLCTELDIDRLTEAERSKIKIRQAPVKRAIGDFIQRQNVYKLFIDKLLKIGDDGVKIFYNSQPTRHIGLTEAIILGLSRSYVDKDFGMKLESLKARMDDMFRHNWNLTQISNRLEEMGQTLIQTTVSSSDEFRRTSAPLMYSKDDSKIYLVDPGLSLYLSHTYQPDSMSQD